MLWRSRLFLCQRLTQKKTFICDHGVRWKLACAEFDCWKQTFYRSLRHRLFMWTLLIVSTSTLTFGFIMGFFLAVFFLLWSGCVCRSPPAASAWSSQLWSVTKRAWCPHLQNFKPVLGCKRLQTPSESALASNTSCSALFCGMSSLCNRLDKIQVKKDQVMISTEKPQAYNYRFTVCACQQTSSNS